MVPRPPSPRRPGRARRERPRLGGLGTLTGLLVALVLVPAGVLGWLGFRGAEAEHAAARGRIERELLEGRARLREAAVVASEAVEQAIREDLAGLARALVRDLPDRGIHRAMLAAARALGDLPQARAMRAAATAWEAEHAPLGGEPALLTGLALVDTEGRILWPATLGTDASPPDDLADRLLADLEREATQRRYRGDAAEAPAVWEAAAARLHEGPLRARMEAEGLLAAARVGRVDAWEAVAELDARAAGGHAEAIARPRTLLIVRAAAFKVRAAQCALHRMHAAGALAAVPLTEAERARAHLLAQGRFCDGEVAAVPAGLRRALAPWPGGAPRPPTIEVPVRGGLRLRAEVHVEALALAVAGRLQARDWHPLAVALLPFPRPQEAGSPSADRQIVDVPLPLGGTAPVLVAHQEAGAVEDARRTRLRLTALGIASLLLLVGVGILLARRAVRRERAARRLQDEFVANVTHEIRTPLTSVTMHAEMLAEEEADADRRRRLARVVLSEGARLASLVDELLDFAALEAGRRSLEIEPVDLVAAATAVLEPYRTLAEQAGVELALTQRDGEVVALADGGAVTRILANLVGNAWKHGRPSSDGAPGRIEMRLGHAVDVCVVTVCDDGPGLEEGERATIFERFRRGRGAAPTAGTGIGLTLARDLARSMGGELTSEPSEQGACFRLELPVAPEVET